MKKKIRVIVFAALATIVGTCSGCSFNKQTEYLQAGMTAVQNLEYEEALTSFAQGEEAGESKRDLYRGYGLAYMGMTQYEDAVAAFEKALSFSDGILDNMDYDINYYLATSYYKLGDIQKAKEAYNAIIALRSDEEDTYYLRGTIEAEQGNLEAAVADFDQVVLLDATNYDRIIDIYCVLNQNGYKEAGEGYLKTAMDSETKGMTNFEKGRICYYMEDYDNARTYLEKAKDEGGYQAVIFLGKTYETLGDYNYAVSVYNAYIAKDQTSPQVYNQLGLCKMHMGEYEAALTAFQTAMEIEGCEILQPLKMNEIVAYEYLQEYKKAAVLLDGYLDTYPDDEKAAREYIFLQTR